MAVRKEKSFLSAYKQLDSDLVDQILPGKEAEAKKVIESLVWLLGSQIHYDLLLDLFVAVAVRVMQGLDDNRIGVTVRTRFSEIVPEEKMPATIACIRRFVNNFAYINETNSPKMKAFLQFFDVQNADSFAVNEKRQKDAEEKQNFGTEPDNPIFAYSSFGSYDYLNLLYTSDGIPLTWKRNGSINVRTSRDPIDEYELMLPDGAVFITVYVNMYSKAASLFSPGGLIGDGLKELPKKTPAEARTITEDPEEISEEDEYLRFLQNYSKESSGQKKGSISQREPAGASSGKTAKRPVNSDSKVQTPADPDRVLVESTTPVLQGNLPVLVGKIAIYKKQNGEVYATVSFLPITGISIRAMQVDFICYDVWHESVQPVQGFQYNDLNTDRRTYFGAETIVPLPDPNTRAIDVVVQRIKFSDGKQLDRRNENIELPSLTLLEDFFDGKEISKEYRRLTYKDAKYAPVKAGTFWRCTCGAINRVDEPSCHKCTHSADKLFEYFDKDHLQQIIDERKRLAIEKREKELLAQAEAQRKEVEAQRAREQKAAEEARILAEKKNRQRKVFAIASCCLLAICLCIYLIVYQIIPASKYRAAEKMLSSGDREGAYSAFIDLGDFRDSHDQAYKIVYDDAKNAYEAEDYLKSAELFNSIPEYSDSTARAKDAVYNQALLLKQSKLYDEAADLFESISDHKDSATQAKECRNEKAYIEATGLYGKKNYKDAGAAFEALKHFRDSDDLMAQSYYHYAQELIENGKPHDAFIILDSKVNNAGNSYEDSIDLANTIEYQYAMECYKNGQYAEAEESFANLKDYNDSASLYLEARYQHGLELIRNGDYKNAEALFMDLGNYKDSAAQRNEASYQQGIALIEEGLYDTAIDVLEDLSNYRDSARQINEAKYLKGLDYLKQEDYQNAEKIFAELGNYNDSAKQLLEVKYQYALSLVKSKEYTKAVPILEELGNYSDSVKWLQLSMYRYVVGHKDNSNKTTYNYLLALSKANYMDSKAVYETLFGWKINIVINASETNSTVKRDRVFSYDTIYCHYRLDGGPPGEKVKLKAVAEWPWGTKSTAEWDDPNYEWRRGDDGYCSWWFTDPSDKHNAGIFTIRFYIGSTLIGEDSVRVDLNTYTK